MWPGLGVSPHRVIRHSAAAPRHTGVISMSKVLGARPTNPCGSTTRRTRNKYSPDWKGSQIRISLKPLAYRCHMQLMFEGGDGYRIHGTGRRWLDWPESP